MRNTGTKNLTYDQRLQLCDLLKLQTNKKDIANALGCCLATIYNEIARGTLNGTYNPTFAQEKYEEQLRHKGPDATLLIDKQLAETISKYILKEHLSPEKIINKLQSSGISCPTKQTIYSAIDNGLIPNVTRKDLYSKTTKIFSKGLVQLPMWVRKQLHLQDGDLLSISTYENRIILEIDNQN